MYHRNVRKRSLPAKQKGNVLFLILIAVALFAALSFAVTQSMRSGGNADEETSLVDSTSVTQFGATVTTAINRMVLFDGISETDLCFYTGDNHADYNHASCADTTNNVFLATGGKVLYLPPPNGANDGTEWEFTSRVQIFGQGATIPGGTGHNAEAELAMLLRGMNQSVCQRINEEVGISGIPVDSGDINVDRFDGDFVQGDGLDGCPSNCGNVGDSPIAQAGTNFGCIEEAASGDYIYFHTLIAR